MKSYKTEIKEKKQSALTKILIALIMPMSYI